LIDLWATVGLYEDGKPRKASRKEVHYQGLGNVMRVYTSDIYALDLVYLGFKMEAHLKRVIFGTEFTAYVGES
jgi:hypothetical protein